MKEDSRSNTGVLSSRHLHGKKSYEVLLKILPGILSLLYISADCLLLFLFLKQRGFKFMNSWGLTTLLAPCQRGRNIGKQSLLKAINLSILLTEQNLSVLSHVNGLNRFYFHNLHFFSSKITFFFVFFKVNSNMHLGLNLPFSINTIS